MRVRFDLFISTFIDNGSRTFSTSDDFNFKPIIDYIGEKFLKCSSDKELSGFFRYDDKWCIFLCLKEVGQTTVRGESRWYDELFVAVSEERIEGEPAEEIARKILNNFKTIKNGSFAALAPMLVDSDKIKKKVEPALMKGARSVFFLFIGIAFLGALFSVFLPRINKVVEHFVRVFRFSQSEEIFFVEIPFENEDPEYYKEIVTAFTGRGFELEPAIDELITDDWLSANRFNQKPGNKFIKYFLTYYYFQEMLEVVLSKEDLSLLKPDIKPNPHLSAALKASFSSKKWFAELFENLKTIGQTTIVTEKIPERWKDIRSRYLTRQNLKDLCFQNPEKKILVFFLPLNTEHNKVNAKFYGADEWEKVPEKLGFRDWQSMEKWKRESLKEYLQSLLPKLGGNQQ